MPGRRLRRDARRHRHRRLRRPCRRGHRPHLHRGAGRLHAGRVSAPPARRRGRSRRRAGQRRQVGARGDGPGDPRPGARATEAPRERRRHATNVRRAVLKMAERVIREGAAREGKVAADIGPDDARALLEAWLAVDRARPARPRADRLPAVRRLLPRRPLPPRPPHPRPASARPRSSEGDRRPSRPATSPAARRRALRGAGPGGPLRALDRLPRRREGEARQPRPASAARVALIADGIGAMHGVTHTIEQIRERGVPGFEVEVVGTDPGVDRRLPAAAELEVPFYEGMSLGVPGLPDLVETLAEGRYDLVHVTAPGPAGVAATLLSRITGMPLLASYHTELAAYAGMRSGDGGARGDRARRPSAPSTRALGSSSRRAPRRTARCSTLGVEPAPDRPLGARRRRRPLRPGEGRPRRLPGRDQGPLRRPPDPREGGRPARRELPARPRAPTRACTCCWPAAGPRRTSCAPASASTRPSSAGSRARSWLAPTPAPTSSSSARSTDTYGQVVLEAGASGLPVVAVAEGGPASLVENRHTGMLCRPDADHLAGAVLQLASSPLLRRHLGDVGRPRRPRALLGARARAARRRLPAGAGSAATRPPRQAARPGRLRPGGMAAAARSTMARSTIPLSTSTASSPGSTSTSGCSNWPRIPRCRCWSGSASARSTPPTSTSSSWSGSPASSTSSTPGSTPAAPTASPPASRSTRSRPGCWSSTAACTAASTAILRPALEEHGIRIVTLDTASEEERREIDARFHEQVFPALTPLVIGLGRPFPYISNLSLSLGVLLRDPESGTEIIARVKVPKELLGRFLPVGERRQGLRAAGGGDRRQPRRALPRHRGGRPRLLPRHPRRRLHRLRRGRRPAAGGPGRDPPPPLRRGRAARDRRRDEPEAARAADRRAAARGPRGLRRRRPDRPRRPRRRSPTSPATPSCATRPGRR